MLFTFQIIMKILRYLCIFVFSQVFTYVHTKSNIILLFIENIDEVHHLLKLVENGELSSRVLPNVYKLMKDSVRFENMYNELSTTSNFAALFTGKPAVDLGMIRGKLLPFDSFPSIASSGGLQENVETLSKKLKSLQYKSMFIGYWKLGHNSPMKHGFESWLGISHPHSKWCHRKSSLNNSINAHLNPTEPYSSLIFKTTFLWTIALILLPSLLWFRIIGWKIFLHLLIYTMFTSIAFYILLHLFGMQRLASCALFYDDFIYQQPYEMNNLTLYFTKQALTFVDAMGSDTSYFLVVNYMKMRNPLFHSNYFRTKSTAKWHSALLELDWSIGEIISTLKDHHIYDGTYILFMGSNQCAPDYIQNTDWKIFQRKKENVFEPVEEFNNYMWLDCLKSQLFIKDISNVKGKVDDSFHVTDVFDTVVHMATDDQDVESAPGRSLLRLYKYSNEIHPDLTSPGETEHTDMGEILETLIREEKTDPKVVQMIENSSLHGNDVYKTLNEPSATVRPTTNIVFTKHKTMFHHYNVEKPVLITYKEKYQLMYAYLNEAGYLVRLNSPWLIGMSNSEQHENASIQILFEEVYQNITYELTNYLTERQNQKNSWSSQFEFPIYPWLLPCAHFPYCQTTSNEYIDFTDLMRSLTSD